MFQVLGIGSSGKKRRRGASYATTNASSGNGTDPGSGGSSVGLQGRHGDDRRHLQRWRRQRQDSNSSSGDDFDTSLHHTAGELSDGGGNEATGIGGRLFTRSCKSLKRGVCVQSRSLLAAMECVEEWQQRSLSRQPVCVMSKNGSNDAGLFCAISICCDQLKAEKEVDVFNAVRYVRSYRPHLVPTLDEYRFIYQFMAELIKMTKSKPDIVVSKPFPTFFALSDLDPRHYTTSTSISSSIHGGVYVTKQDDKAASECGLLMTPSKDTISNHSNNDSSHHSRRSSGNHLNQNHFENIIGTANSFPLTPSYSGSHGIPSIVHEPTNLNLIPDPLSSVPSEQPPNGLSSNASDFNNHRHFCTPDSIHSSSFSTAANTTPNVIEDKKCTRVRNNQKHPSSNGFRSPKAYMINGRENFSNNNNNSLCKSSSFFSCDSVVSDNFEDSEIYRPNFDLVQTPHVKQLGSPDRCNLGTPGDSYSTLKDLPMEDNSISFQLDGEDCHSSNTSCLSIEDSCNEGNTATTTTLNSVRERNNNCPKTTIDGRRKKDKSQTNYSEKKTKREKWHFSLPKALVWKKK